MSSLMPDTLNPATLMSRRFRPDQIPDLTGRVAIVTGGSAGIGYFDALALARANAKVIIVSANEEHGKQAEAEINQNISENGSTGSVHWYQVQLGDLKDVDKVAKKLAQELDRVDIVICNAGIGQAPYGMTSDGLERHFEVNNLSHYVLILRLLPLLKKTAEKAPPTTVRVVMQSSEMHRVSPNNVQFASKDEINKEADGSLLYGRTKLGQIYFAKQLVKRKFASMSPDKPILAISVHPGTVDTEVQKAWTESYGNIFGKALENMTRIVGKSAPEGAEASLWAATSSGIYEGNWKDFQGQYYTEADGKPGQESSQAKNEKIGDNFWELCATLTKEILGEELR
ncbi:hypothetical protein EIP91_003247 [Steccherinum ochraceum]|uniref:NAD(P)-binding protein n=1 Tax=Steccherinum ochraceum TaxID=92696 RepID=A0A4R0RRQ1_9APHY|nr:hypothetical protein EIP91_003247 [Steccherinum ochraceum]